MYPFPPLPNTPVILLSVISTLYRDMKWEKLQQKDLKYQSSKYDDLLDCELETLEGTLEAQSYKNI